MLPPASFTLPAASSALSTATYVFHLAGADGSIGDETAATSRPRSLATK
jgi:hypothetical protein